MTLRPRIESLGVALPERRMTMDEVVAGCRRPLTAPIAAWTGIHAHRRAGEHEFAFDLALRAIESCLSRSRYAPADVDLLLNCNISRVDAPGRFSYEPATAARLAARLGFDRALAFDLTNACAGMFTGLALAADFLANGRARRAIVVSGEYITHLSDTAQRLISQDDDPALPCLTLGDAGAALLVDAVDTREGVGFEVIDLLTLGRYCQLCVSTPTFEPEGGAIMKTHSVRLGFVGIREGIRLMKQVLERIGKAPKDFQHFIAHQTSLATITSATRAAEKAWPPESHGSGRTVINLAERGNTASTTHFVALWDEIAAGRIQSGDRILFTAVASGLVAGVSSYTLDDLPERLRTEGHPVAAPPRGEQREARWATQGSGPVRLRFESTGLAEEACEPETFALCRSAGEAVLKRSRHGRRDVSHLVFFGVHRTDWISEPAIAAFVAGELRLNEASADPERSTLAFDVTLGRTGFLAACELSRQLLAVQPERKVLLVSSEVDPNLRTRPEAALHLASSGAALLLDASPDPERGLGSVLIRRYPELVDLLGSDFHFGGPRTYQVRWGEGEALTVLLARLSGVVDELLAMEGLTLGQIKAVLVPEPAPGFRARVATALGIELGHVYNPPGEQVDRYTCALPYLLHRAPEVVGANELGLLIELGSGLTVAAAIYRF